MHLEELILDSYFGVNSKWYNGIGFRKSWKEFDDLTNVAQITMMLMLINMVLKVGHH